MSVSSVVLPAPVEPMIAVVRPGSARNEMSCSTGALAPGYWNPAPRNSSSPRPVTSVTGSAAGTTDESVSSTSSMRSAQTAARGTIISMKVAIMTAIRICMRYCRNAVSAPTWI